MPFCPPLFMGPHPHVFATSLCSAGRRRCCRSATLYRIQCQRPSTPVLCYCIPNPVRRPPPAQQNTVHLHNNNIRKSECDHQPGERAMQIWTNPVSGFVVLCKTTSCKCSADLSVIPAPLTISPFRLGSGSQVKSHVSDVEHRPTIE